MLFLKSPFNKVVRSTEAGIIGLLVGILVGILVVFIVPSHINEDAFNSPVKLCGKVDNVKSVNYSHLGKVKKVVCKDNRVFDDF